MKKLIIFFIIFLTPSVYAGEFECRCPTAQEKSGTLRLTITIFPGECRRTFKYEYVKFAGVIRLKDTRCPAKEDAYNKLYSNYKYALGCPSDFYLWVSNPEVRQIDPKNNDFDGDGIMDFFDTDPKDSEENSIYVNDCDSDGDGIIDSLDLCPDTKVEHKGLVDINGCVDYNQPEIDQDGDKIDDRIDPYLNDNSDFSYRIVKHQECSGAFTIKTERGDYFTYGKYTNCGTTDIYPAGSTPWKSGGKLPQDFNASGISFIDNPDVLTKENPDGVFNFQDYGQSDETDKQLEDSIPDVKESADQTDELSAQNQTNQHLNNLGNIIKAEGTATRSKLNDIANINKSIADKIDNLKGGESAEFPSANDIGKAVADKNFAHNSTMDQSLGNSIKAESDTIITKEDAVQQGLSGTGLTDTSEQGIGNWIQGKINSLLPSPELTDEEKANIEEQRTSLTTMTGLSEFQIQVNSSDCRYFLDFTEFTDSFSSAHLPIVELNFCHFDEELRKFGDFLYWLTAFMGFVGFMRSG